MFENVMMVVSFVVVVTIIAGLSWVAIKGSRKLAERGKRKLDSLLFSLKPQVQGSSDLVQVKFPVYVGTVFYVVEYQPEFYVERKHVRRAVNSMAGFSLKYGLLTGWAPYVVFMVFINYLLHAPKLVRA